MLEIYFNVAEDIHKYLKRKYPSIAKFINIVDIVEILRASKTLKFLLGDNE